MTGFGNDTDIRVVTTVLGQHLILVGCREIPEALEASVVLLVQGQQTGPNTIEISYVPGLDLPETSTGPHVISLSSIAYFHTLLEKARPNILEVANEVVIQRKSKQSGLILPSGGAGPVAQPKITPFPLGRRQ